jgi:hypothetical protein
LYRDIKKNVCSLVLKFNWNCTPQQQHAATWNTQLQWKQASQHHSSQNHFDGSPYRNNWKSFLTDWYSSENAHNLYRPIQIWTRHANIIFSWCESVQCCRCFLHLLFCQQLSGICLAVANIWTWYHKTVALPWQILNCNYFYW